MMSSILRKQSQRPKRYHCDFTGCTKSYTRPCLLEQHIRTHSNERPFQCEHCPKSFFRDSHLKVHSWTHSSEKPLKCSVCSKGFVTSQQLSRHSKTHKDGTEGGSLEQEKEPKEKKSINNISSAIIEQSNEVAVPVTIPATHFENKCPYECEETFQSEKELSQHMLSEHIMNDFVDENYHKIQSEEPTTQIFPSPLDFPDISDVMTPDIYKQLEDESKLAPPNSDINDWDSHHFCKEPICVGFPGFESYQDLIFHYDHFHRFIPQSLYEAFLAFDAASSTDTTATTTTNTTTTESQDHMPRLTPGALHQETLPTYNLSQELEDIRENESFQQHGLKFPQVL